MIKSPLQEDPDSYLYTNTALRRRVLLTKNKNYSSSGAPYLHTKLLNITLEKWVFVESAFNMQCYILKNALIPTAFSVTSPVGSAAIFWTAHSYC